MGGQDAGRNGTRLLALGFTGPVAAISAQHVRQALQVIIDADHAPQAERVRQDLQRLFGRVVGRQLRPDNPATLDALKVVEGFETYKAPKRGEKRHARVAAADLPALFGQFSKALRFTILTAARPGEVEGARWSEIHPAGSKWFNEATGEKETLATDTWIIPGDRMKARKLHRVPLTKAAMALIGERPREKSAPLSDLKSNEMLNNLQGVTGGKETVHGFRSTFRDWAGRQEINGVRDLAELALAHNLPGSSTVERRYARADALDERLPLMTKWAAFCTGR